MDSKFFNPSSSPSSSSSSKLVIVVLFATFLLNGVICSNLSAKARHGTHWNRIGKRFYESMSAAGSSAYNNDNSDENRSNEVSSSSSDSLISPLSSLNYEKDIIDSQDAYAAAAAADDYLQSAKRDTASYFNNNYLTVGCIKRQNYCNNTLY